jgi:hypothetical protein
MQGHSDVTIRNKRTKALHQPDREMPPSEKATSSSLDTQSDGSAAALEDGKDRQHIAMSHTGSTIGLAGSDILAERMNPDVEISDTADPSDIVEVTPENLVNRNAPGSTTLKEKRANHEVDGRQVPAKVIRRVARDSDASGK